MQQFFRAGFRQVQDPTVVSSEYLFLVPSYLDPDDALLDGDDDDDESTDGSMMDEDDDEE
jgi:hypothetical protein